jgi:hypothetical protein
MTRWGWIGLVLALTWTDNAGNETAMVVERQRNPVKWDVLTVLPANATQYLDVTVNPGRRACYRVRASNQAGTSPPSNVACGVGR